MKRRFALLIIPVVIFADTWETFNMSNSPLPSNKTFAVCIEPSGVKWFGTDAGLVRYDGFEWLTFVKTEDQQTLADDHVTDIAFERTSHGPEIWVGTRNGLTILDVDGFSFATPYRKDNRPLLSNQIHAVAVDSNHVKWFATDQGVSIFNGTDWWALTEENEKLKQNDVLCIGIDNECDSLWRYFGTPEKGISRLYYRDLDAMTSASPYDRSWTIMMSDSITAFLVIHTQKHWIGTGFGLYEHDSTETKRNWHVYTTYEGLVHNAVLSLAQGADGSLWIGTCGGASHYSEGQFDNYTDSDGLADDQVNDIAVDSDGSVWFATQNGVTHFIGETSVESGSKRPEKSRLLINFPNPFNPETMIEYELTSSSWVSLAVFDLNGREVKQLALGIQDEGTHRAVWDGTDQAQQAVPAGVYMARLTVGTKLIASIKMLLIR
jgi:ligand-binding sensor domain-containing protein